MQCRIDALVAEINNIWDMPSLHSDSAAFYEGFLAFLGYVRTEPQRSIQETDNS